ncbi:hypothetical protein POM88_050650 [Heracleum sosnowskyi]|uniref:Uncharacterized protein n=1 Tax=Heracleum sosnowskyi TaxID=360622 RepID=A0AAD8M2L1_9APIA|nr:hypothetical protein POM88_050650 [Heracleum sosnowskyi]
MDPNMLAYASLTLMLIFLVFKLFKKSMHLPPKLPIIGRFYVIKEPLTTDYRTLDTLSKTFGPVFSLCFGSFLIVIVSSLAAVDECFTKNDVVLASRPRFTLGKYIGYNWSIMALAPYGDH